ncbi:mannosyl-glycoprotein endo-beta-N-acetylglucosamidase, partial [Lactobacillus sp. XV13L]|nr:mannosyl-glycoprotein endo-beta-N-acetylglucosamidase [Lactobacillus sp. XV13L]
KQAMPNSSITSLLRDETDNSTAASLSPATTFTPPTISKADFLSQIKAGALNGWQQYHILPSITGAQAILESGWGNSQLAQTYNNLFGIKGSYNGQSVVLPSGEEINGNNVTIDAQFRAYNSWAESINDHGLFLNNNSRYQNLLGVSDYRQVAQLLQQDGYATASTYAQSLINIIESNNLQSWDQEVLGNSASITPAQPINT